MEGSENGISRRSVLKRIGAGAAIAWVTPVITTMNTPAFARVSPVPCDVCASACGGDPACFCLANSEGGKFCSNDIFCSQTTACPNGSGDCPPGWFCQDAPCAGNCGEKVCIPGCGVAVLGEGTGQRNRP